MASSLSSNINTFLAKNIISNQRASGSSQAADPPGHSGPALMNGPNRPSNFAKVLERSSARFAASALAGVLMFACFPLLNWDLLVWVTCFPLLAALLNEPKLGRAFLLGYASGTIFLAGSCYWFAEVMERYGQVSPALAVGILLLFVIVFAVLFGMFGWVEGRVARRSKTKALLLAPFLWVTMEFVRTYFITGFPWNLLGYAVQSGGLKRLASITAVYGLSFLAVLTSALLAWVCLESPKVRSRLLVAAWCALLVAADLAFKPPALAKGLYPALLVQPDVPLDDQALEAWVPSQSPGPLDRLLAMSLTGCDRFTDSSSKPPLVVWAENPAPFYFGRDSFFSQSMEEMARRCHAYVVFNTITFAGTDNSQPRNSAILLGPKGNELFEYDKIHLVPFGEYVPRWAFPGKIGKITSQVGDFVPGSGYRVADTPQGKVGIFICYEAIFPQVVRRLAAAGAEVLVNISNDTWFGNSAAPSQHLEMARMRAVENQRFLLRATNDGITALIDPYGRVIARLPRHRAMILAGRYNYLTAKTFYTLHGDVFAWLCVVVAILLVGSVSVPLRENPRELREKS